MTPDSPTMTPETVMPETVTLETVTLEVAMPEAVLPEAALAEAATPEITTDAAAEDAPVAPPPPPPPKVKAITWETERNAAAAALVRAGATPREARVLASNVARAATALRPSPRYGPVDITGLDDRAAVTVLAAHRAAASPNWSQ